MCKAMPVLTFWIASAVLSSWAQAQLAKPSPNGPDHVLALPGRPSALGHLRDARRKETNDHADRFAFREGIKLSGPKSWKHALLLDVGTMLNANDQGPNAPDVTAVLDLADKSLPWDMDRRGLDGLTQTLVRPAGSGTPGSPLGSLFVEQVKRCAARFAESRQGGRPSARENGPKDAVSEYLTALARSPDMFLESVFDRCRKSPDRCREVTAFSLKVAGVSPLDSLEQAVARQPHLKTRLLEAHLASRASERDDAPMPLTDQSSDQALLARLLQGARQEAERSRLELRSTDAKANTNVDRATAPSDDASGANSQYDVDFRYRSRAAYFAVSGALLRLIGRDKKADHMANQIEAIGTAYVTINKTHDYLQHAIGDKSKAPGAAAIMAADWISMILTLTAAFSPNDPGPAPEVVLLEELTEARRDILRVHAELLDFREEMRRNSAAMADVLDLYFFRTMQCFEDVCDMLCDLSRDLRDLRSEIDQMAMHANRFRYELDRSREDEAGRSRAAVVRDEQLHANAISLFLSHPLLEKKVWMDAHLNTAYTYAQNHARDVYHTGPLLQSNAMLTLGEAYRRERISELSEYFVRNFSLLAASTALKPRNPLLAAERERDMDSSAPLPESDSWLFWADVACQLAEQVRRLDDMLSLQEATILRDRIDQILKTGEALIRSRESILRRRTAGKNQVSLDVFMAVVQEYRLELQKLADAMTKVRTTFESNHLIVGSKPVAVDARIVVQNSAKTFPVPQVVADAMVPKVFAMYSRLHEYRRKLAYEVSLDLSSTSTPSTKEPRRQRTLYWSPRAEPVHHQRYHAGKTYPGGGQVVFEKTTEWEVETSYVRIRVTIVGKFQGQVVCSASYVIPQDFALLRTARRVGEKWNPWPFLESIPIIDGTGFGEATRRAIESTPLAQALKDHRRRWYAPEVLDDAPLEEPEALLPRDQRADRLQDSGAWERHVMMATSEAWAFTGEEEQNRALFDGWRKEIEEHNGTQSVAFEAEMGNLFQAIADGSEGEFSNSLIPSESARAIIDGVHAIQGGKYCLEALLQQAFPEFLKNPQCKAALEALGDVNPRRSDFQINAEKKVSAFALALSREAVKSLAEPEKGPRSLPVRFTSLEQTCARLRNARRLMALEASRAALP